MHGGCCCCCCCCWQINYGGRVTDDLDRRCLMTILEQYYTVRVLDDDYRFSSSGTYYAPINGEGTLSQMGEYLKKLPMEEQPEVFGMHDNALVAFNVNETGRIVETVLSIQPRVATAGGDEATPEQLVDTMAADMQVRVQLIGHARIKYAGESQSCMVCRSRSRCRTCRRGCRRT